MDRLTIRRATIEDADGLGACLDAAYALYAGRIAGLPDMSADCAEDIATNLVWVAETDGAIVGALVLTPGDGFMKLANIAVDPAHQGTGLGRRLLALAEAEARDRGFTAMRLNTHAQMPENVRYYERNGWLRTGQDGVTVMMTKTLVG